MRRTAFSLLLLAGASPAALAADIEASSTIDSVTVFPDGAQVTRIVPLDLPPGSSTVVLKGLAPGLDPSSVRVEAEGRAAMLLGPVETRLSPGDARPAGDPALDARIEALQAERARIDGRTAAADVKKRAIERYAEASPEKLSPESKPLDVAQWSAAWDAIGSGLAKVNEELRELSDTGRRLDAEIAALQKARPGTLAPGAPRRDVTVSLDTEEPTKAVLKLTYRVAGAGWQPLYDIRLDTGGTERKPSLELVRRAQITQRTGEDWTGVALMVSTSRTARGTGAPDVQPLLLGLWDPADETRNAVAAKVQSELARRKDDGAAAALAPAPASAPPMTDAAERMAEASAGSFQASFRVPGRISVPQDGTFKTFALSSRRVEPSLAVKVAPALDETAYLETAFVLDDDIPLLAGDASLHRDGSFVGRSRLSQTAPGDRVELGFGADDRVKVTRVPVRKRESDPGWIGSTRSDLRDFKTTIRNLHEVPLRITVVDQLPVPENTAITVEQVAPMTPPTDKQVADRRGVVAWTWDYAPGEQKEIRLAYRVKWPGDRELVTRAQPAVRR